MIPLYFGTGGEQLFGGYDPPRGAHRRQGVVVAYPWGQEYIRSHQTLRHLARLLATQGQHVLRFDYFGTGDSDGEGSDVTFSRCVESLRAAIDELHDMADIKEVALVGLRFGALVAAAATASARSVSRLVLWDPVDGESYAHELLDGNSPPTILPLEQEGFPVTKSLLDGLQATGAQPYASKLPRVLVVDAGPGSPVRPAVLAALKAGASEATELPGRGPTVWTDHGDFGAEGMPVDTLREITEWLTT